MYLPSKMVIACGWLYNVYGKVSTPALSDRLKLLYATVMNVILLHGIFYEWFNQDVIKDLDGGTETNA